MKEYYKWPYRVPWGLQYRHIFCCTPVSALRYVKISFRCIFAKIPCLPTWWGTDTLLCVSCHPTHLHEAPRLRHQPLSAAWLEQLACLWRTGEVTSVSSFCFSSWVFLHPFYLTLSWFCFLASHHATDTCLRSHDTLDIAGFPVGFRRAEVDCQLTLTVRRHG